MNVNGVDVGRKVYSTKLACQAAIAAYRRRNPTETVTLMTAEEFAAQDVLVESVNLVSGEKIMIHASEKGGCCDPGTETYWNMLHEVQHEEGYPEEGWSGVRGTKHGGTFQRVHGLGW